MEIPHNHIYEEPSKVFGFNMIKRNRIGHVTLYMTLVGKVLSMDFLLMSCRSPYDAIFGRDWRLTIDIVTLALYQCDNSPIRND